MLVMPATRAATQNPQTFRMFSAQTCVKAERQHHRRRSRLSGRAPIHYQRMRCIASRLSRRDVVIFARQDGFEVRVVGFAR